MTYLLYLLSGIILLHRATCSGCSLANFASDAKFHWAGRANPVSNSLIPIDVK